MAFADLHPNIDSFLDLQVHELALWGIVPRTKGLRSKLVVRGFEIGYVRVSRLQTRSPRIRISIGLTRGAELLFGQAPLREFETTVVQGVRKCLWGDGAWPKHTVEFTYRVETSEQSRLDANWPAA
jgi:hypothetical protein